MDDPREDEVWPQIDHSMAAALLAGHLPSADHTPLTPLGEGDFCLAFSLGDRVVRVAKHRQAAVALRREACMLPRIADRLPLPVPRPTYHQPVECPPFTIHDAIVGDVLTRDGWLALPAGARAAAANGLATFLGALHALPVTIGLECGLIPLERAAYARRLRDGASSTLYPLLDVETREQLDAALGRWSASSARGDRPAVLLHCDIAPGHLLFEPLSGELTGVIDFGDLAIGEAARDFIFVYEDFGPEMLAAVLSRYPGEGAASLLPRIRMWYLLEAVSWTVYMNTTQQEARLREGIAEITRELGEPAGRS